MPEAFAHIFEVVGLFLSEVSGMKVLLTIFSSFCAAMTLYQLIVEFKHLFGGHSGEEGAKPATPGTKPEGEAPAAPAPAA
jgi:hypothetical protein